MRIPFALLLFLNSGLQLSAQKHLSLDDCLDYSFEHNLILAQYLNEVSESKIRLNQSYLAYLPSVRTEYNHFMSSGKSLNLETYSWSGEDIQQGNAMIIADLTIFQGLYNLYHSKASNADYVISNLILEREKLFLCLEIIKSYHNILLFDSDIKILENTHFKTQNEITQLEEQIKAGIMPRSDLFEMRAQEKKEMLNIISLRTGLEKEYSNLKKLMNWQESDDPIIFTDALATSRYQALRVSDLSRIIENILRNSVVIVVEICKESLLEYELQMQRNQIYPEIIINAALSSRYLKGAVNPIFENDKYGLSSQLKDNQYKQIGFTVSFTIFDSFRKKSNIKLSELKLKSKRIETEYRVLLLKTELLNIQNDIFSLAERINETEMMAEAYEKSYDFAREKYISGLIDLYSLNTAKNNYINSLIELSRLSVEHKFNLELLSFYEKFVVTE